MTAYRFRAARSDGEALVGTVDAASAAAAADLVTARGLFPIDIRVHQERIRAASADDLATSLSGLAALLDAGLPVDRALAALEDTAPPRLLAALTTARVRVTEGASLSYALAATGAVPAPVLGLLKAGERTGRLAAAVHSAALALEHEAEMRARVRTALTYPVFLAVAGTASVVAIAGFVVPRFAALLDAHGSALPATTRALLALSTAVAHGAVLGIVLLVVAVAAGTKWLRTDEGRLSLHRWLLALPLIGALRLRFASARTCGALAALLDAGVPMLTALELAGQAGGDRALELRLAAVREEVNRGERVATALERHRALSALALRLAHFGDRSGKLPAFLAHAARLEERTAQRSLQRGVALLEPLLILGFGAVVAFVAAALLQAVYSIRPGMP